MTSLATQSQVLLAAKASIIERTKLEIEKANKLFGLSLDPIIKTDLQGRTAGTASHYGRYKRMIVNINAQMMTLCEKNWWTILDNTISHEIAHLVDYATRGTSDHSPIWKNIHRALGGTGERCHSMKTIKRGGNFQYNVNGKELNLSSTIHNRIISGQRSYMANGVTITKNHLVGQEILTTLNYIPTRDGSPAPVIDVPTIDTVEPKELAHKAPVAPVVGTSKRQLAAQIYFNNQSLSRKELIGMMVAIGLTAAGASTYISNFKTGKWEN